MGGSYEVGLSQNPINVAKVTPVANGHPITRGCGGYIAEDEWYFDIRLRPNDANVVPILTGKLPPRDPQDKVLSWAYTRPDGGRGFGFTGGHFHKNWHIESFRKMVLNGIVWTAGIEVPQGGVASMRPWRFVSIPDFVERGSGLSAARLGGHAGLRPQGDQGRRAPSSSWSRAIWSWVTGRTRTPSRSSRRPTTAPG